jgi:2-polyprenyl-6-methoxyphenol hydroxylase-like FAD-dependent oxidoreductase
VRRAGWDVRVVERTAHARELGFALLLAPNAIMSLRALGLADRIIEGGVVATRGFMKRADGVTLRTLDASKSQELLGEPTVMVLRPVLHGALLEATGTERVSLGCQVTSVVPASGHATVLMADGTSLDADLVIGADGVGSVVRRALHPQEPPPRPSGLVAVRGVAYGVAGRLQGMTGGQYFGRGVEAGVAQASTDAVYWYLSLPSGMAPPGATARRVAAGARKAFEPAFQEIIDATKDDDLRLDELLVRKPLDSWGRGTVTLLGDAAHPMLPHAGQGAAQALEDAAALGQVLANTADAVEALRRYESVRIKRTRAIAQLARRKAHMGSLTNPLACYLRDAMIRAIPESVILRSLVAIGRPPSTSDGQ